MNIDIKSTDGRAIIAIDGDFTFGSHATFRNILVNYIEQMEAGGRVIFDLQRVNFVDSAALGMLLLAREAAMRRSGQIVLQGATGQVQRLLTISRFDQLFQMA